MTDIIDRQTASYRQGLVLGLTMAEIMLLLVFCLLIAVGVALSSERAKRDDALLRLKTVETAAARNEAMISTIRRNARLAELLDRTGKASQRERARPTKAASARMLCACSIAARTDATSAQSTATRATRACTNPLCPKRTGRGGDNAINTTAAMHGSIQ